MKGKINVVIIAITIIAEYISVFIKPSLKIINAIANSIAPRLFIAHPIRKSCLKLNSVNGFVKKTLVIFPSMAIAIIRISKCGFIIKDLKSKLSPIDTKKNGMMAMVRIFSMILIANLSLPIL